MSTSLVRNNLRDDTFGGTKNALHLVQRLRELGDGSLSWKLKKRFSKTMTIIRFVESAPTRETRAYLTQLVLRDTERYLATLGLSKEIHDRFHAAIRNQCLNHGVGH